MSSSITRIADFLNAFSKSCSGRLSYLDSRLTALERKVSFLESKVEVVDEPRRRSRIDHQLEEEVQQKPPAPGRTSDESEEEEESCLESQARC